MNDYILTAILIVAAYGIASIVRDAAATLRGFRRWATPRDPNPEPGPPRIDGWRAERDLLEAATEEARDHLIEIRRAELLGEAVPQSHRPRLERVLRVIGDNLRDLNTVIAESEGENR